MRMRTLCCFLLGATPLFGPTPVPAQAPLQPEQVGVATIPAATPRIYAQDIAIGHIVDGRMHVLHAETLAYLGLVPTGFAGMIYVPPKGEKLYVATSYIEKISRGARSDFLEIYDPATLAFEAEIPIPPKRAQALNYRPLMQGSADGRFVFVQNATPATSITIVDLPARKVAGEVPNPGCYGIYPSAQNPARFATICGDGQFGSYTLAADGASAARRASGRIFDVDQDALFSHAERDGDTWLFLSYPGNIYRIDIEGEAARLVEKIPLAAGVEGDWRPGGYQPFAYDPSSGVLYALMHKGGREGSHKNPAEEIWAFDVKAKKLLSRSPSKALTSLAVAPGARPVLYGVNPIDATILRYAVDPARQFAASEATEAKVGEAVTQIEIPQ